MKIVFMGTPSYAIPSLEMLHKTYGVSLVVTQPDKKIGRKGEIEFSPVKKFALEHNIPLFQPEKMKLDYQTILEVNPDVIITAAYGQMIPDAVLNAAISLNLHGSLLPKYRGGAPVQYAIKNGDTKTGVTLMYMVKKMDAGDMIATSETDILATDTTETLMSRLGVLAATLLERQLPLIMAGKNTRIVQNPTEVTFAYNIKPTEEILDFNQTSEALINHLRSLLPTPGASIFIKGVRIKVYEMEKSDIISHEAPGTILSDRKALLVKTGNGVVSLLSIQPENKKVMMAKDFLNGQKLLVKGDVFNT
ncbi:MAG: methionyl-tRNA formyltransferase [Tenericutes bacterium HGW-Tenericutes-8]|nr:MAG: methionyl-tRNA formyltransferase [Tenericutes bacterium HGW-Tenericutes-8]